MNRFEKGTIVIGKGIELTEDEILRLEIELIELERLLDTDQLEYDSLGNLIVRYELIINFMDQQSLVQSQEQSNTQPSRNTTSIPSPFLSSTHRSTVGHHSRTSYNDYGNEQDDIKPREKRFPLKTIYKTLLLDDGRFLNLTARDPQSWPTVLEMWSQTVTRKSD